jgi:sec-independent protein translocase protein TatB
MFEIGFSELLLVTIVALLVLGPERLPNALRTLGLWLGRLRRSFNAVRDEIEREIGMDDIRRQLHNEAVLDELRRIEHGVKSTAKAANGTMAPTPTPVTEPESPPAPAADDAHSTPPAIAPDVSPLTAIETPPRTGT